MAFYNASHVEIASEEWDGQWWIDLPKLEVLRLSTGSIQGSVEDTRQEGPVMLHISELRIESGICVSILFNRFAIIEEIRM